MGWDYEVSYWGKDEFGCYRDFHYWGGDNYRSALRKLRECRALGYGCVYLACRNNPADAGKE